MTDEQKITMVLNLNNQVAKFLGKEPKDLKINVHLKLKNVYGTYNESCNILSVSEYMVDDKEIKNTILHELCHAYAPRRSGHGVLWQNIAKKVGEHFGEEISRTSQKKVDESIITKQAIAALVCSSCGGITYLFRKSKTTIKKGEGYVCIRKIKDQNGKITYCKAKFMYVEDPQYARIVSDEVKKGLDKDETILKKYVCNYSKFLNR